MRASQLEAVATSDKVFKHFERSVREWIPLLGFHTWHITITRDDTVEELASCIADVKYGKVRVSANAARMLRDGYTPLQVESTAVHELVHAMLWTGFNELANPAIPEAVASHFEELTTEHVAASLLRAKYGNHPAIQALWSGCFVVATGPTGSQELPQ